MNIFVLDCDIELAARYHSDVHKVSQLKEGAQILSSACALLGIWEEGLYRPTHLKHPCVKWAAASVQNAEWLLHLCHELNREFHRYRKAKGEPVVDHKSMDVAAEAWFIMNQRKHAAALPKASFTPPPQVVPVKYRKPAKGALKAGHGCIEAYRAYYAAEKREMRGSRGDMVPAAWRVHGPPPWWSETEVAAPEDIFEDDDF